MEQNYYVYALCDSRKSGEYSYTKFSFCYEPFYIGYGRNDRMYEHTSQVNLRRNVNALKTARIQEIVSSGYRIVYVKIYENLFLDDATFLETEAIELVGRQIMRTGLLTNMVSGGYGHSLLQESKDKISQKNKGKKRTPDQRKRISQSKSGENHPFFGKPCSDERRKNISAALIGKTSPKKKCSEERKELYSRLFSGEDNPNYGNIHSEETRSRMSEKVNESYRRDIFLTIEKIIRNGNTVSIDTLRTFRVQPRLPIKNIFKYVTKEEVDNYIAKILSTTT